MEFPYPDPEGILDAVCELCHISMDYCVHSEVTQQLQRLPTFTHETFLGHPDWPQETFAVNDTFEPELPPPIPYFAEADTHPLYNTNVQYLNENATTVQPSTVQYFVEDTYTPGDRLQAVSRSRRPSHRRQAPRPGGFPCPFEGCGKTFDRACDVKRHQKTHLSRTERPHKCAICDEGFLYPKDLARHQNKHTAAQGTLFCHVPGCGSEGFSRKDNLLRHIRKQHSTVIAGS
ncbi:hypothetical protein CC80DRAFT_328033 [Byssothecium circinans]|uniref:C2H2-type domain-containing protein n=1 Tax=Byssothecium circinans TaxID=147558 RepID=A0A6A5T6I8_9PLEO|nr:hypothetical protein CC80DRAFT_328033 [Byssothecium circinans]